MCFTLKLWFFFLTKLLWCWTGTILLLEIARRAVYSYTMFESFKTSIPIVRYHCFTTMVRNQSLLQKLNGTQSYCQFRQTHFGVAIVHCFFVVVLFVYTQQTLISAIEFYDI